MTSVDWPTRDRGDEDKALCSRFLLSKDLSLSLSSSSTVKTGKTKSCSHPRPNKAFLHERQGQDLEDEIKKKKKIEASQHAISTLEGPLTWKRAQKRKERERE